jgi:mannose-6-phosphate isomerase-like protein (cupin superfamily)
MAFKNKIIINTRTGQKIRFLQTAKDTNGRLLEMEADYAPFSKAPPPHCHPHQEEDFLILRGQMTVRMDGKIMILHEGERLHIPAGISHSMWNHSGQQASINWKTSPALDTEYFIETINGLIEDKKRNQQGMRHFLQMALTLKRFSREFRLTKISLARQRIIFALSTPVALLAGYKSHYKKYLD